MDTGLRLRRVWMKGVSRARRTHISLFLLTTLLAAASGSSAFAADERPVVLAIGESTTEGYGVAAGESYPAQLQALLDAQGYRYQVVNHGRSGSTTAMALAGLDRGLRLGPTVVIIALGGNDSGSRLAAERTRENLRRMVSLYVRIGARVLLADRGGADGRADAEESLFAQLAREEGAELIPSLREGLAARHFLADGRHPNAEGYAIVAQRMFDILEPQFEKAETEPH